MGRRKKSSAKRVTKKQAVVEKIFKCPFCGHDKSVVCKMELQKRKLATLMCRVCSESYQSRINCAWAALLRCGARCTPRCTLSPRARALSVLHARAPLFQYPHLAFAHATLCRTHTTHTTDLSEPIDVYCDWIDSLEDAKQARIAEEAAAAADDFDEEAVVAAEEEDEAAVPSFAAAAAAASAAAGSRGSDDDDDEALFGGS